jgi:hypothetical protein
VQITPVIVSLPSATDRSAARATLLAGDFTLAIGHGTKRIDDFALASLSGTVLPTISQLASLKD